MAFWGVSKIVELSLNSTKNLVERIDVATDTIRDARGIFERVLCSIIHLCDLLNEHLASTLNSYFKSFSDVYKLAKKA